MTVHRPRPAPGFADDIPEHPAMSHALKLAGRGLPAFPCKPDKAPCTERERKARPEAIYSKLGGCA